MASHDDTLVEHVEEALGNGIAISEFPTTMEAARHARKRYARAHGSAQRGGAAGRTRGISPRWEIAQAGYLGSLSSDYVPSAFLKRRLPQRRRVYVPSGCGGAR